MDIIQNIGNVASTIVTVGAMLALLIKPVRRKLRDIITDTSKTDEFAKTLSELKTDIKNISTEINNINLRMEIQDNAEQSLLSSEITRIYYGNLKDKTLKEFEAKTLDKDYKSYRDLDGNGYIERLYNIMKDWEVIS